MSFRIQDNHAEAAHMICTASAELVQVDEKQRPYSDRFTSSTR